MEHSDSTQVLNKGFVYLDNFMGDDLSVVNAARVSYANRKEIMDESDEGLIRFLMKNRHGTPFEHNAFTFVIKCPIFTAREWMRHRIGSFNEMSGRYVQLPNEFYVPHANDIRKQVGKPGHYTYEEMSEWDTEQVIDIIDSFYELAWTAYQNLQEKGVAKEIARIILPVGIYTQFYWTINARSLMNFLSLRNHPTAMREIRYYAEEIETIFAAKMPVTVQAFIENGRIAP